MIIEISLLTSGDQALRLQKIESRACIQNARLSKKGK